MRALFFIFFSFFFLVACKKEQPTTSQSWVVLSERLQYQFDKENLILKSGQFQNEIPKSNLPFQKVIILTSSLTGYFTELDLEEKVVGISSPEYIYSEKIQTLIQQKKISNIGNEQKYNLEQILALKPDAIFTNYVPNFQNTYDILKQNGIQIVFLDEFLEANPLSKSKYLLLFGELFGIKDKAEKRYAEIIKNYNYYKNLALKSNKIPKVICNEMYGNQWFLPGGKTSSAIFIKDANADYILKDDASTNAIPMSFEEVFMKSKNVNYWVNLSSHKSKSEMLTINANYAKLDVFNNGKMYMINKREKASANDFFISGNVRADLVLKDYVNIFHPEVVKDHELFYFKELK